MLLHVGTAASRARIKWSLMKYFCCRSQALPSGKTSTQPEHGSRTGPPQRDATHARQLMLRRRKNMLCVEARLTRSLLRCRLTTSSCAAALVVHAPARATTRVVLV